MAVVVVEKNINASVDKVFASWTEEFASIYKFNPNLNSSHLLGATKEGGKKGSTRQCDLNDGKNWLRERVLDYVKNEKLVIDIYESSMPIKTNVITFHFKSMGINKTRLTMVSDFELKIGIIGKMMAPLLKMKFKPMLKTMLDGNANYVESGIMVNPDLKAA